MRSNPNPKPFSGIPFLPFCAVPICLCLPSGLLASLGKRTPISLPGGCHHHFASQVLGSARDAQRAGSSSAAAPSPAVVCLSCRHFSSLLVLTAAEHRDDSRLPHHSAHRTECVPALALALCRWQCLQSQVRLFPANLRSWMLRSPLPTDFFPSQPGQNY